MKTVPSHTYRIWIAGDYQDAVRACRSFCERGACVAVQRTTFVYTGGVEEGVCVTLINYPRFPATEEEIFSKAHELAEYLRLALFQDSYSIEGPKETVWFSRRDDGGAA